MPTHEMPDSPTDAPDMGLNVDHEDYERVPMVVGDISLLRGKLKKLYSGKRFHERTQQRFFWPNELQQHNLDVNTKDVFASLARDIWVEFGMGPASLLPFARPFIVRKVMAYDSRPWVAKLMAFSHNKKAFEHYKQLLAAHGPSPDARTRIELRRETGGVSTWREAGVVLYLLSASGGEALFFADADTSLAMMPSASHALAPWSEQFPMYPVQVVGQNTAEMFRSVWRFVKPLASHIHLHVNAPLPDSVLQEFLSKMPASRLSWSFVVSKDQRLGKTVHNCALARVGKRVYALPPDSAYGLPREVLLAGENMR